MWTAISSMIRLLRPNILLLATYVFTIIVLLVVALYVVMGSGSNDDFLKGALIGLIGTGITALTAFGNNILEKDSEKSSRSGDST